MVTRKWGIKKNLTYVLFDVSTVCFSDNLKRFFLALYQTAPKCQILFDSQRTFGSQCVFNPYPANVENMVSS